MVYRKGDKGDIVRKIQLALGITADGVFGVKTETAVKQFQKANNLDVDGIVGILTLSALGISSISNNNTNECKMNITLSPITNHITKKNREIKYIVLHYTAGSNSKKGAALQTRNQFQNSNRDASADFCVDDETIIQTNSDPVNYYCWAVGDGKGKYGITNSNCISIEMCSTLKSGTSSTVGNHSGWSISNEVLDNTVFLVKHLMKKYNIPLERVVRHYDASRKSCPGILGWNENETYSENGKIQKTKNNSDEWNKFKERLK